MKYIILQNIFTPYRVSLFDELHRMGFPFEVFYMRETEADRHWFIDPRTLRHPFHLYRGFYRMVGRFHVHFNPRLILAMLRARDSELILGVSWNDLNVIALALLKRLGILRKPVHFWSEANYLTIGSSRDNVFKRALRNLVFGSSTGAVIIPGRMSEITFQKWGITGKSFVTLPNTIEEEKFHMEPQHRAGRLERALPVIFISARLVERLKGILNFFQAIGDERIRKAEFVIAGDGPDRSALERFVEAGGYERHIRLLGHCSTEQIVHRYSEANVFLLPSFSDQSPLTVVEALAMELPLLISNRCGNHYEAVDEGRNGYIFDPYRADSIRGAFDRLLERRDDWPTMGAVSAELYRAHFAKGPAIARFISAISTFSAARSGIAAAIDEPRTPENVGAARAAGTGA